MSDTPPVDSPKRFRVAFSFAGEKRDFVAEVAAILAQRFGKTTILYDEYHKAEFARDDLVAHLTKLYRDCSDLIIVVLCRDYDTKPWCGLEWKTIRGLLKKGKSDEIMLTRYELVEPEELEGLAGFIDLEDESAESAAALILERLALNERNKALPSPPVAFPTSRFPSTPPEIPWPLADGIDVRDAVKNVLCAESKHRIVLVRGESGRGKSAICRHLRNLQAQFKWLRCGRFELKGAVGVDRALDDFILDLRATPFVPASALTPAYQRANDLLDALNRSPQPTLLVFDAFDQGGEFSRWVEERVLLRVVDWDWLRVVVAGQDLPGYATAMWAALAAPPIEVNQIAVGDWLEFGRRIKKDLSEHDVKVIHKVAGKNHGTMQTYILELCKP